MGYHRVGDGAPPVAPVYCTGPRVPYDREPRDSRPPFQCNLSFHPWMRTVSPRARYAPRLLKAADNAATVDRVDAFVSFDN
jgi:hypothetical protein